MYYGNNSDEQRVVEWINNATMATSTPEKVEFLRKVQEVLINKSPQLLMRLLPDLLGFTADRDGDVKKWLVGFIEDACKKNHVVIEHTMTNLHMLLCDKSVQVQKRVIQAASSIYRNMLMYLANASQITDRMEQAWNQFSTIKMEILNMVDSDNDGIRTHSVKFLEGVVLIQSYPDQNAPRKENDFSLEDVPLTLKFARRRKLEEEANHIFTLLVKFHGSQHISSVNLMACMGALCTIAKARPEYMPRVVSALEALLNCLPPTLTPSQVNSVKKHLKLQIMNILKHPNSTELHQTLLQILTDLGTSVNEISRALPKLDDLQRKRLAKRNFEPPTIPAKRPRIDQALPLPPDHNPEMVEYIEQRENALKLNEQFISDNLNAEAVTEIVMHAMLELPNVMPAHFSSNYAPAANIGVASQKRRLTKLLGLQFLEAGIGPGGKIGEAPEIMKEIKKEVIKEVEKKKVEDKRPRIKMLKLEQVTKPLPVDVREVMLERAVKRILQSEQAALKSGASTLRNKIITTLASTFGNSVKETVLGFILEDLRGQIEIALSWLYEEYSFLQGFSRSSLRKDDKPDRSYNRLLCALITNLEGDAKERDALLSRVLLEAPLITEEAMDLVKRICIQESRAETTMNLLYDLVFRRPTKAITFVNVLLHHTSNDNSKIREEAISRIIKLYEKKLYQNLIEEQATVYLDFLNQSQPPAVLFGDDTGREQIVETWTDEACKACLYLYCAILPLKEVLIHNLAKIYIQTTPEIKRVILRLMDQPIRSMGMESPELLKFVESCTKGTETLVTRFIHILTDRGPPSPILVSIVRDLYQTRVSDVRFLIPVLNGLTRKEIIAALPKLIKLTPGVVKEVFNRLLVVHAEGPITPAELLIALHQIDQAKADLKTVMKATSLCFNEKAIYTQEVLAVVMQQLMDVTPLPTLLMRTVIQSLSLYPRLSGFVMNILQRLILKQVWKQKVVWEGFVKCCQRTKPQSFQVLLQLPAPQLGEALAMCPDLQHPLLEHVNTFNETQRAHIPVAIMDVLIGKIVPQVAVVPEALDVKIKIESKDNILPEPLPPGMD